MTHTNTNLPVPASSEMKECITIALSFLLDEDYDEEFEETTNNGTSDQDAVFYDESQEGITIRGQDEVYDVLIERGMPLRTFTVFRDEQEEHPICKIHSSPEFCWIEGAENLPYDIFLFNDDAHFKCQCFAVPKGTHFVWSKLDAYGEYLEYQRPSSQEA